MKGDGYVGDLYGHFREEEDSSRHYLEHQNSDSRMTLVVDSDKTGMKANVELLVDELSLRVAIFSYSKMVELKQKRIRSLIHFAYAELPSV